MYVLETYTQIFLALLIPLLFWPLLAISIKLITILSNLVRNFIVKAVFSRGRALFSFIKKAITLPKLIKKAADRIRHFCVEESILSVLFTIVLITLVVYLFRFGVGLDGSHDDWMDTVTYFNNLLTPILLTITAILVNNTWKTSKKELKDTKDAMSMQTELLLFNQIETSLKYTTNEVIDLLKKTIDHSEAKSLIQEFFNEPKNANTQTINPFYLDMRSLNEEALETYITRFSDLKGVVEAQVTPGKPVDISFYSLSTRAEVHPKAPHEPMQHIHLMADRIISIHSLLSGSNLQKLDSAMVYLINYLNQIKAKHLQKALLLQLKELANQNGLFGVCLSLYQLRLLELDAIKIDKKLITTAKALYEADLLEIERLTSSHARRLVQQIDNTM